MSDEKFDKILGQVRALIAKADSTEHPGEESLLRAKAESLMLKYRIEEALVFEKTIGQAGALTPVWLKFRLNSIGSDYARYYSMIAGAVMKHCGVKGVTEYSWTEDDGQGAVMLNAVGFDTDLRFLDLLLTSCLMEFGKRMEPSVDSNLSDQENAYNLRNGGWTRKNIARELFGPWSTENEMKAKNRKVTGLIKRQAAALGESTDAILGRSNNMNTYRESYASGFVSTINGRLTRMRLQAMEMEGGGLIPISREEAVLEAFYTKFPAYRPKVATGENVYVSPRTECEKCKRAKSGYCREHGYLRPTFGRAAAFNDRAYNRGTLAAQSVDLGTHGSPNRIGN